MSVALLHSQAEITRQLLIDGGVGVASTLPTAIWPIYETDEPDKPDNCITIYDTMGSDDGRVMTDGEIQEHLGLQIRIRSVDHNTGFVKAWAIRQYLSEVVDQTSVAIGEAVYRVHCYSKFGRVLAIGKDVPKTKRKLFTVNCLASITNLNATVMLWPDGTPMQWPSSVEMAWPLS